MNENNVAEPKKWTACHVVVSRRHEQEFDKHTTHTTWTCGVHDEKDGGDCVIRELKAKDAKLAEQAKDERERIIAMTTDRPRNGEAWISDERWAKWVRETPEVKPDGITMYPTDEISALRAKLAEAEERWGRLMVAIGPYSTTDAAIKAIEGWTSERVKLKDALSDVLDEQGPCGGDDGTLRVRCAGHLTRLPCYVAEARKLLS